MKHIFVIHDEPVGESIRIYGIPLIERLVRQSAEHGFDDTWIVTANASRLPSIEAKRPHRILSPVDFANAIARIEYPCTFYFTSSDVVADDRFFGFLKKTEVNTGVRTADDNRPLLIRIDGETLRHHASEVRSAEALRTFVEAHGHFRIQRPADFDAYVDDLRLLNEPYLFRCFYPHQVQTIENRMYEANFKGTLDFIAIYIYKYPVREIVKILGRFRWITPNQITILSILASFAVPACFASGQVGWGISIGWLMFILDSVDGKLARLTVRLSKAAGLWEHATSTPAVFLWFPSLGWCLSQGALFDFSKPVVIAMWILMPLYWIDKSVNGAFRSRFKKDMYNWSRFDEKFHLVACRRAIIMLIVTIGYLAGSLARAFVALAGWMVVSFLVHMVRFLMISMKRPSH